jgi:hypothetical protein
MRSLPAAVAGAALVLTGCGYTGEPQPPLANLPARVADLSATQRGSTLIVQFSVPRLTTEGMAIKSDVKLDLRVGPAGDPFNAPAWAEGAKAVPEGEVEEFHAIYSVPAEEWKGKEVVIGVRVKGANGKDAGWSNFVVLPVVPAPERPGDLRGEAVAGGVRLTWRAGGNNFRVYRRTGDLPFAVVATPERPDWTDTAVENGKPYDYIVQSVVKTGENREAESDPSAAVQVTPVDKFPPAVPAGLQAAASPVSIELAWEPAPDSDLAGYRVYRAAAGADFTVLGESTTPSYSDRAVEHGKSYRYAVSSFDKSGNESARSAAVEAALSQ